MSNPTPAQRERSKLTKEQWREYTKTVWQIPNVTHPEHPAVFPEEIPRRLIQLFSFDGETVLDPFGGIGTTAKAGLPLGRRVICVEQNKAYVAVMRRECEAAIKAAPAGAFTPVCGDSRAMSDCEDGSIDLVVTSPPYWNKANYGRARTTWAASPATPISWRQSAPCSRSAIGYFGLDASSASTRQTSTSTPTTAYSPFPWPPTLRCWRGTPGS